MEVLGLEMVEDEAGALRGGTGALREVECERSYRGRWGVERWAGATVRRESYAEEWGARVSEMREREWGRSSRRGGASAARS
jgi:hypothetical protein